MHIIVMHGLHVKMLNLSAYLTGNTCSCNSFQDVVFVIDTSTSIDASRFQLIREFVGNITAELIRNSPRSAVGVILFGSTALIEFNLQDHTNLSALLEAINQIPYSGGNTYTNLALSLLLSIAQNGTLGLRNDSSKVAIIVTDGQSTDSTLTKSAADELHNSNIFDVFAVGVGGADQDELQRIASNSELVFNTANFSSTGLKQIKDMILPQLCIGKYPMSMCTYVCM